MDDTLQIFLIILIAILCASYIFISYTLEYVNTNWSEYRCQPIFMVLAGLIGHDANENNKYCVGHASKKVANTHSKLTGEFMDLFNESSNTFSGYASDFGNKLATLDSTHTQGIAMIKSTINNVKSTLYFMMEKLKIIMKKLLAIATIIIYTLFSSVVLVKSMAGGVIGEIDTLVEGKCFAGDTLINGRMIKDIEIKGNILAVMKFKYNQDYIYLYDNVKVTGEHLVLENGEWKYIKDSELAEKIPFSEREVYCLITKDNQITINNTVFSDFIGVNGTINNAIRNKVLEIANDTHYTFSSDECNKYYESGVLESQVINTSKGFRQMKELDIGDIIPHYGKVLGVVRQKNNNWISIGNTFTTPGQIVLCNNTWTKAIDHPEAIRHRFKGYTISINTTLGLYKHSNLSLFQYDELPNKEIEDNIIEVINA